MSRSVETYTRGCQNYSLSNTQGTLNILIGSLFENRQDGEPSIIRHEKQISDEGLTDDEWKIIYSWKNRLEPWSQQTCMSCQTQCSAQFLVQWIQISASKIWEEKAKHGVKSNNGKNRNDICKFVNDIEWHVCLGDMSGQIQQKLQGFMSEAGHEPESFPDRIIFASMLNNITNW